MLVADTGGERFMTMILMVVDIHKRRIRWASAGHDAPIVYDPEADEFTELAEINGLPLGVMPDSEYEEAVLDGLGPGRIILVGTDGIWETRSPSGEEFGKARLRDLIRDHRDEPADRIAEAITDALRSIGARPIRTTTSRSSWPRRGDPGRSVPSPRPRSPTLNHLTT